MLMHRHILSAVILAWVGFDVSALRVLFSAAMLMMLMPKRASLMGVLILLSVDLDVLRSASMPNGCLSLDAPWLSVSLCLMAACSSIFFHQNLFSFGPQ
jgi:hypothetical protein